MSKSLTIFLSSTVFLFYDILKKGENMQSYMGVVAVLRISNKLAQILLLLLTSYLGCWEAKAELKIIGRKLF